MKLSREAVQDVRAAAIKGKDFSLKRYAEKYRCSEIAIRRIVNNESYADPDYECPIVRRKTEPAFEEKLAWVLHREGKTAAEIAKAEQRYTRRSRPYSCTQVRHFLSQVNLAERPDFDNF